MNQEEIRRLLELLIEKNITEFEHEAEGTRVRVKRGPEYVLAGGMAPALGAAPAAAPAATAVDPDAGLIAVKSPIVGTFYESPSPGAPEFVRVGDTVEAGQVLCIIEAMKLMNEIEAELSGVVARKLVTNGQPVEYGQSLMLIRPQ